MGVNDHFWRGKRALVTGHTGFMGGWLTVVLNEFGARVIGYALAPPTVPSFFEAVALRELLDEDVRADVRDLTKLLAVFRQHRPEIVFHLAAQPLVREAFRRPVETFDVNVMGAVNVLEAAREADSVRSVVVVTTDKVYENLELDWEFRENDRLGGREPYGVSKACAELVVDAYRQSFLAPNNIGVATVRAGNIIGGGDWAAERLVPDIVRAFSPAPPLLFAILRRRGHGSTCSSRCAAASFLQKRYLTTRCASQEVGILARRAKINGQSRGSLNIACDSGAKARAGKSTAEPIPTRPSALV